MPQLARLRFVHVGHREARADDLLLPFTDGDGAPTDSTLWLRNGGGKSSLLALFFSLLVPDTRKFLGRSGGEVRELGDYVRAGDTGVVAAEWILDSPGGTLDLGLEAPRLVIGSVLEWPDARGDAPRQLERAFFSCRTLSDAPATSIDKLPLVGPHGRANMRGLRQQWAELRLQSPMAEAFWTDRQHEWVEQLESLGLDSRLFVAQATMNQGEGEADRLFTDFKSADEYVKYFLQLLAPAELTEPIVRNLEEHRAALRFRTTALLPERDLVAGLVQRIEPLARLQATREARGAEVARCLAESQVLDRALLDRAATASANADAALAECEAQKQRLVTTRDELQGAQQEASWCERWLALQAVTLAERERAEIDAEHRAAEADGKLWGAVHTLATVRRHEATVGRLEAQLVALEAEHRPLRVEVEAAAQRLGQALEHRRMTAEAGYKQAEADIQAARTEESGARSMIQRAIKAHAAATHASEEASRRRLDAERELDGLAAQGMRNADEPVPDAVHRQKRALDVATTELHLADEDQQSAEARKSVARAEQTDASERAREGTADVSRLAETIAQATAVTDQLGRDPELSRLLEVDQTALDVRQLDQTAVSRLRQAAEGAEAQVLARHVEVVTETRALQYLESHGTLPPSPVVERLLQVLRSHLPQAWDGWGYLAQTLSPDEARAVVRRAPALATGIVVRDQNLDAAVAALGGEVASLEEPVLIAPTSAVQSQDVASRGVVLGPADDAHFSRNAGDLARVRRTERRGVLLQAQEQATSLRESANRCAIALDTWLKQYPPSWWRDTIAAYEKAQRVLTEAQLSGRNAAVAIEQADVDLRHAADRRDRARTAEAVARRALDQLKSWQQRHPGGLGSYREKEQAAEAGCVAATESLRTGEARSEAATAQRDDAERRRAEASRTASDTSRDLKEIMLLPVGELSPLAGDVALLRQAHLDALNIYNAVVGTQEITRKIADARNEAELHRATLRQQRGETIKESDVEAALATLPDPAEALQRQELAAARRSALWPKLGNVSSTLALRQNQLKEAEAAWVATGGLALRSLPVPESDGDATIRIRTARVAEQRAAIAISDAEQLIQTATELARDEESRSQLARGAHDALVMTLEGLDRLSESLGRPVVPAITLGPLDEVQIRERPAALGRAYAEADAALRELDRERDSRHHAVQAWCDEPTFVGIPDSVGPRIKRFTAAQIEGQARDLLGELEHRAQFIADDLAATEKDRAVLIRQALGAAREGAQLLSKLARNSMIPDTIPNLGGHVLLQSIAAVPETEEEGLVRMGVLLDEYIARNEIPGAILFLQEAVIRLAGSIKLKVLRPTMDTTPRYEPITTLAKFSGGEKLTVATLLYCALATTRARTVGRRVAPTSTLLMDNPFGRASRASFITLQREVAKRLGIQLVYLTGINDLEALRCFPTVVRCDNARYDRHSGERRIEVGDADETAALLSAVRIARREPTRRREGEVSQGTVS
jgi:hypothetical protein